MTDEPIKIDVPNKTTTHSQEQLHSLIKLYYKEYFDLAPFFEVIDKKTFSQREFGFNTLERGFMRNKSFKNTIDLLEFLKFYTFLGVYSGGVYDPPLSSTIRLHDTKWVKREVVFDFDINEYDPVRTCGCKGRQVCPICWELITDAIGFISDTLKEDFGQKNFVWVFTGGRGVHCWIRDPDWAAFTQNQRNAIIGYLGLIHDPTGQQRVDPIPRVTLPFRERIYQQIVMKFIHAIPRQALEELELSKAQITRFMKKLEQPPHLTMRYVLESLPQTVTPNDFISLAIKYRYPRVDHKVTIDTRRLLRMPGTIHGGTGYLSTILRKPTSFTLDQRIHVSEIVK